MNNNVTNYNNLQNLQSYLQDKPLIIWPQNLSRDYYPFILKVDDFEGFSNQKKFDKIVNDHLCNYHSKFKNLCMQVHSYS